MFWWDSSWFPMPLGFIVLCLVMMGLCMLLMRGGHGMGWRRDNSALDTLNERFARGEIGEAEYKARREAIMHS